MYKLIASRKAGIVLLAGSAAAEGNHSQAWVLTHTAISITRGRCSLKADIADEDRDDVRRLT